MLIISILWVRSDVRTEGCGCWKMCQMKVTGGDDKCEDGCWQPPLRGSICDVSLAFRRIIYSLDQEIAEITSRSHNSNKQIIAQLMFVAFKRIWLGLFRKHIFLYNIWLFWLMVNKFYSGSLKCLWWNAAGTFCLNIKLMLQSNWFEFKGPLRQNIYAASMLLTMGGSYLVLGPKGNLSVTS